MEPEPERGAQSISLASYARETLERHVRDHYETQARLYTVAVVKLLGVATRAHHDARFGGVLYCFLRGLDARGQGLWSSRPSWDDVERWERDLEPTHERSLETPA